MARDDLKAKVVLTADTKGAEKGIKRVEGSFRKFGTWLSTKFVFTLGDVKRAFSAITGTIKDSAALQGQTQALQANLAAQGMALDEFLANLDRVAQGQIAQADLIAASSQAILLGIPADQIAELLEVAAASSIATGATITSAFNDIAIGIGRASPMILDNLGLVVKLGPTYAAAAAALGKTVEELTPLEMKMGLLNSVLDVGRERVELFGDSQSELSKLTNQASATWGDFGDKLGHFAGTIVGWAVGGMAQFGLVVLQVTDTTLKAGEAISRFLQKIPIFGDRFEAMEDTLGGFRKSLEGLSDPNGTLAKVRDKFGSLGDTSFYLATGIDRTGKALEDEARRLEDAAAAAGRHSDATNDAAAATVKLKEATEDDTVALDEGTTALDSYFASLQQRNREEERGIGILQRKVEVQKQSQALDFSLAPMSTGQFSGTFSSFTPWDEMTSAQRERFLRMGGQPPDASQGWVETP